MFPFWLIKQKLPLLIVLGIKAYNKIKNFSCYVTDANSISFLKQIKISSKSNNLNRLLL